MAAIINHDSNTTDLMDFKASAIQKRIYEQGGDKFFNVLPFFSY